MEAVLKIKTFFRHLIPGIILILCTLLPAISSAAGNEKTIALLPFEIIAMEEADSAYLKAGVGQMLRSRLVWKGHVSVMDDQAVSPHLETADDLPLQHRLAKMAELTGSDYVLTGSITQYADAFSIDTRIYDAHAEQILTFFDQSTTLDELIPKVSEISAKINKTVFDRETEIYKNLVEKEKEKAEQIRRQHPDKLIPVDPGTAPPKPSLWRFWEYLL